MKKKTPKKTVSVQKKRAVKKNVASQAIKPKKELNIGMHLLIAGSAIAVLMFLGIVDRVTFSTLLGDAAESRSAMIGIEHNGPVSLSIVLARKNTVGYISITNESRENIRVSVPEYWKRIEISGVPLRDVTQDEPVFGFIRYALPAGAGMKMLTSEVPSALLFDSNSKTTAAINLQTIDLADDTIENRTVLLKDKALARLWESEE